VLVATFAKRLCGSLQKERNVVATSDRFRVGGAEARLKRPFDDVIILSHFDQA